MPGHNAELGKGVQGFDLAAARQLLADAGHADRSGLPGFRLRANPASSDRPVMAEFVRGELRANLGIEITPVLDPTPDLQQSASGDFDAIVYQNVQPTTQALLQAYVSGHPLNGSRYSNPAYDRALTSAGQELDPGRRLALWQEAHQILVQDSPAIFLVHNEILWLRAAYVRGLAYCYIAGPPGAGCFSDVWIDKG